MDRIAETLIPNLGDLPLADFDRYAEAAVLARILDVATAVPAARFQSSI